MNDVKAIRVRGDSLPNMPWEEKPEGYPGVCWRYSGNPVIRRDHLPKSNSIFNSAVVPFQGKFAGVFRVDDTRRCMRIHAGFSEDGIAWRIEPEAITFGGDDPETLRVEYAYDPRVVWIDDRYWVTWCNGYHGPTIGVAWTRDFRSFTKCENAFLPFNRNGVLFPRKVNGKYLMLSRPSDNGHTPFGDIFISASPDMEHWGHHRHVMSTCGTYPWQSTKIGAGPIPIATSEGWLMIYHGVLTSCNGFVYSFGAALLDLDEPWKVIARGAPYILSPQAPYELAGDVPNVAFPCAALTDEDTGRIAIYYGCADTHTGLAFCHAAELVAWVKENNGFPVPDVAPGVQP